MDGTWIARPNNLFPNTTNLQHSTLKSLSQSYGNSTSMKEQLLNDTCRKHFGKSRNFSFCQNVFKSHLLQRRQKAYLCGKWLNHMCLRFCNIYTVQSDSTLIAKKHTRFQETCDRRKDQIALMCRSYSSLAINNLESVHLLPSPHMTKSRL